MLYHYYMPGDSVEKMKESGQFLKQKMALLNVAVLPESLKERGEQFPVCGKICPKRWSSSRRRLPPVICRK